MYRTARQVGQHGEAHARTFLEERGYRILATNYRCPHGEIDIVAADGNAVVFVEVRTRRSRAYGPPEESLTAAKRHRLVATAEHYLQRHALTPTWRIDVVAMEVDARGAVRRMVQVTDAVTGDDLGNPVA